MTIDGRNLWEELGGSPSGSYERGSASFTRSFKIPWDDIDEFSSITFPSPFVVGNTIVTPPAVSFPGKPWIVANKISIAPMVDGDAAAPINNAPGANRYDFARITIDYSTPEFEQDQAGTSGNSEGPGGSQPVTFLDQKLSVGGEFIQYPNQSLEWEDPKQPGMKVILGANKPVAKDYALSVDVPVNAVLPLSDHTLTWNYVPFPPWRAIKLCLGRVNAYSFGGVSPECLLFLGAEASREVTSQGVRMWKVEYKFSEKDNNSSNSSLPRGWNYFLRPDGQFAGSFQKLRKKLPRAYTKLEFLATEDDNAVQVVNHVNFPRFETFKVRIGDHKYAIEGGTTDFKTWVVTPTVGVGGHQKDDVVEQIFETTLSADITASQQLLPVASRDSFPKFGQFFLKIDEEIVAVTGGHGAGAGNFLVLRGVSGTRFVPHANGALVEMVPNYVYDVNDFRLLLLSGLITG